MAVAQQVLCVLALDVRVSQVCAFAGPESDQAFEAIVAEALPLIFQRNT